MATDPVALLRRNLGDTASAFTPEAVSTLLDEQEGDQDRALRQGLWEMLAQGARWHDYTTDMSQEKKSQIFAQIKVLYDEVNGRIVAAEAAQSGQAAGLPARTTAVKVSWEW